MTGSQHVLKSLNSDFSVIFNHLRPILCREAFNSLLINLNENPFFDPRKFFTCKELEIKATVSPLSNSKLTSNLV